jgi:DNA repair ATPase RecN
MDTERLHEQEARIRALEHLVTKLQTQLEPVLALVAKLESLTTQLADLKVSLGAMKAQAVILGALATFLASLLSSVVCGLVVYKLTH